MNLHEELVVVERRLVNYPLSGAAADAFRGAHDRSACHLRAASDFQGGIRWWKRIGLRKEATDRVETVRDTVRETKVEVEQSSRPGGNLRPGRDRPWGGRNRDGQGCERETDR